MDGTQDISGIEQESICFRGVDDDFNPYEVFVGFYHTKSTTGDSLAQVERDAIQRLGLKIEDLRFQTYDGAGNMSGQYKGCQAVIKQYNPLALYVHCGAHVTSLVASNTSSSIREIRDTLKHVQDLGTLHSRSGKVKEIFKKHQEAPMNLSSDENEEAKPPKPAPIKPLCPTRFLTRSPAVESVLKQYPTVLASLDEASDVLSKDTASTASRLFDAFVKKKTLLALLIAQPILEMLENLNKSLQSRTATACSMMHAVKMVIAQLKYKRNEETFTSIYKSVDKYQVLCKSSEINLEEHQQPRKRFIHEYTSYEPPTVEARYRQIYYEYIDTAVTQLEERFNQTDLHRVASMEKVLFPPSDGTSDNTVDLSMYPEIKVKSVQHEVAFIHNHARNSGVELKTINDMGKFLASLECNTRMLFPSVCALTRLLLLCPASSCEAERSFSSLRRLKTWLRSSMGQERLSALAVCHTHKDMLDNINIERSVEEFVTRTDIRKHIYAK